MLPQDYLFCYIYHNNFKNRVAWFSFQAAFLRSTHEKWYSVTSHFFTMYRTPSIITFLHQFDMSMNIHMFIIFLKQFSTLNFASNYIPCKCHHVCFTTLIMTVPKLRLSFWLADFLKKIRQYLHKFSSSIRK